MLRIPGRIPVQIYPSFFIVAGLISLIYGDFNPMLTLLWASVIFLSLLVHEFGHALTAVACGQKASIDLMAFGGATRRSGKPLKYSQEFIIVFNGPLAGFALGCLSFWLLYTYGSSFSLTIRQLLAISYYINFFWTAINLLPVQPLDGGQLLRIVLEGLFGLKGLKVAFFLSFLVSLALSIYFFIRQDLLPGSFFLLFTFEGYRAWKNSLPMTQQDDNRALQHFYRSAERDFHKGQLSYAQEKLNVIRNESKAGILYQSATNLLGQILYAQGHAKEAYDLLYPIKNTLNPEMQILFHKLAYDQGLWQEAIEMGNKAYQHQPSYQVALANAIAHAQLAEAKPAIGWMQCAIRNGLPNLQAVIQKSDFNPIRNDPLFLNFIKKQY